MNDSLSEHEKKGVIPVCAVWLVWVRRKFGRLMAGAAVLLLLPAVFGAAKAVYGTDISAKAYVVMEASCGQITAQKNAQERLPMASTTKIMTAYLALQQPDCHEIFTVDAQAIKVEGTSMGLTAGDTVSLYDLACGMLLASGNDAANAAAVRMAGSTEEFARLMNEQAQKLNMEHTHFTNPSGLPDEEHYSTAYDMALLASAALRDPAFRGICSAASMSVTVSGVQRTYRNHNRLLSEYEGCIGIKTGFTKAAGRCLVSAAVRDNVTLICVTLSAPDDWNDHKKLLDAGFAAVEQTVLQPEQQKLILPVVGGTTDTVNAYVFGQITVCLTKEEAGKVTQEWRLHPIYFAPVNAGQVMGQVRYYYEGRLLGTQLILAGSGSAYASAGK